MAHSPFARADCQFPLPKIVNLSPLTLNSFTGHPQTLRVGGASY
jgi:hypothetical protein